MGRVDITEELSNLVRKQLSNNYPFWAEEVELDFGKNRVDFVGYKPFQIYTLGMCTTAIERGIFSFYEVKSSLADSNSGHGKTFVGDENYLVCERELADELYRKEILPDGVKILVPNKPRTSLIVAFDTTGFFSNRSKSSNVLLWNMINARKSNKVESFIDFEEEERKNDEIL